MAAPEPKPLTSDQKLWKTIGEACESLKHGAWKDSPAALQFLKKVEEEVEMRKLPPEEALRQWRLKQLLERPPQDGCLEHWAQGVADSWIEAEKRDPLDGKMITELDNTKPFTWHDTVVLVDLK